MGMSKSRGALPPPNADNPQKCFDVPSLDHEEIQYSRVPVEIDPTEQVKAEKHVARTASDLGTIDEDSKNIASILAYIEGSTITCTFYTQLRSDSYGRSSYNSFSESLNPVHQSYRKINNFQMKLKDSVRFNYTIEKTQSGVEGEAVLYPYFCPYQGDMFIYQTNTNKLGLFKITEAPERLSISSTTCHSIKFILITWVTDEILKKLNDCVDEEVYFKLSSFLNSKGSFLTSSEDIMVSDVKKAIAVLTHHYVSNFYESKVYRTFIENDCLYDPYIVEFLLKLFDSKDLPSYPVQLKPDPKYSSNSFWHLLLDPDYTPEEIVIWRALKLMNKVNYRTTTINALANRCYIQLEPKVCGTHPYPPFKIPEEFDDRIVTVPMQVRLYLEERKVWPHALLELSKEMLTVRRISGFYFIPIVIFLLKILLKALNDGEESIIYTFDANRENGCYCDCSDCMFNCHPPHSRCLTSCPGHNAAEKADYVPHCGGCQSDDDQYPFIYSSTPIDETNKENKMIRYKTLDNVPPKQIPTYGANCPCPPCPPWPYIPVPAPWPWPPCPPPPPPSPGEGRSDVLQICRPPYERPLFLKLEFFEDDNMEICIGILDGRKDGGREKMKFYDGSKFINVPSTGLTPATEHRIVYVTTSCIYLPKKSLARWTWYNDEDEEVASSAFVYPAATPFDPVAIGAVTIYEE